MTIEVDRGVRGNTPDGRRKDPDSPRSSAQVSQWATQSHFPAQGGESVMRRRKPPDPQRLVNRAEAMLRAQGSQSDGQSVRCPGCGNQVALAAARMHALTCAALLSDVELSVDGVLSFRTLPSPDVEAIG